MVIDFATPSLTHPLTHSLTPSLTHSFTHSLTPLLTHMHARAFSVFLFALLHFRLLLERGGVSVNCVQDQFQRPRFVHAIFHPM